MKKLTAMLPDDADLAAVLAAIAHAGASDLRLESIAETVEVKRPARTAHRVTGKSVQSAIMAHFTPGGIFTRELAMTWVERAGFSPTSAGPACSRLIRAGYLARTLSGKLSFEKAFVDGQKDSDTVPLLAKVEEAA